MLSSGRLLPPWRMDLRPEGVPYLINHVLLACSLARQMIIWYPEIRQNAGQGEI